MDLVIGALCEGSDGTWAEMLRWPNKPFKACLRHAFVTVSQFARVVSTASMKPWVDYGSAHLLPFVLALNLLLFALIVRHSHCVLFMIASFHDRDHGAL
jgi:hypothetical protein